MILQAPLAPRKLRLECIQGLDLREGMGRLGFILRRWDERKDTLFFELASAAAKLYDTIN
jgi:hypothetical protein